MDKWAETTLGAVLTLQRGFDLAERMREDGTVPIVSSSGVSGYHSICKVKAPGVVTGRYGTLGEVFYLDRDFWPLNTTLWVKDFKGNDPRFASYLLKTLNLSHHNAAGAVPGVNRNALHMLSVTIPPLRLQQKIASILSAYDDLIKNNTRRIKILEAMAHMIYREWLVHFRFPGHENVRMVDSELGPIPEGWAIKTLASVAGVNERSVNSASAPEEIHYIDIASVTTARIEKKEAMLFKSAPGRARRIVSHGDIIWSTVRPNRRSYALILHPEPNLIVSTGFAVLTAKTVPYSFLYFATTTNEFASYLANHATGSAYPAVNGKDFEKATITIPEESIGKRFHGTAGPMLELAQSLDKSNFILRTTRDFLLPKLISGEVPVEAAEDTAADFLEQIA